VHTYSILWTSSPLHYIPISLLPPPLIFQTVFGGFYIYVNFFGGIVGWTQDFAFARQALHHLSYASSLYKSISISLYIYICIYYIYNMYNVFFIHSLVVGHLSWFHNLTRENRAAINLCVQVSLLYIDLQSFRYILKDDMMKSEVSIFLAFWENSKTRLL
jgi:hypothetical protein